MLRWTIMILEEATFEAYGYYPSALKPQSNNLIIAACETCGAFRITKKSSYRTFCGSCSKKGKYPTDETRTLLSAANKGKTNALGYIQTEEQKAKMSAFMKGKIYSLGCKRSKETKALMSAAVKGEKNHNWKGGISFEPYCVKFNDAFKEYIRAKFGYRCFLCPTTQAENGKKLSVHHVNYNKNCGCDGDKTCQFVPLCKRCHTKTNANRNYWQKVITDKLHRIIIGWAV